MTILITGAAGQLAQALITALQKQPVRVIALTRQQLDITDTLQLSQVLRTQQPTIVINCAAFTAVDKAEIDQAQCALLNATAVKNLANCCKAQQITLIHFSTDYVFAGDKNSAYTEQDCPKPINHYGKTKLDGERAITQSGCRHYIIRTSWLYSHIGRNFYTTMLSLARTNQLIRVVNDQIGTPTLARNLAVVVSHIVTHSHLPSALPFGLYHYSDGVIMSWYEFAAHIFEEAQLTANLSAISSADYQSLARRPLFSALNSSVLTHWLSRIATK